MDSSVLVQKCVEMDSSVLQVEVSATGCCRQGVDDSTDAANFYIQSLTSIVWNDVDVVAVRSFAYLVVSSETGEAVEWMILSQESMVYARLLVNRFYAGNM